MGPSSITKPTSSRKKPINATMKLSESDPSQVRVCVRVRPITAKEQENGTSSVLDVPKTNVIQLSGRRFTFDSVFDAPTSQIELYQQVAPSLIQSFLDGFNATVR
jgi:kinesin family member 15